VEGSLRLRDVRHAKRESSTGADPDAVSSEEPESLAMSTHSPSGNPENAASNQELRVALEDSVDALPAAKAKTRRASSN
jgi:hypothetical protein